MTPITTLIERGTDLNKNMVAQGDIKGATWAAEVVMLLQELPKENEVILDLDTIPEELKQVVRRLGKMAHCLSVPKPAEEHGEDFANAVRATSEFHNMPEEVVRHSGYLEDKSLVAFHAGTSPNSENITSMLVGIWNWVHESIELTERVVE